RLRAARLSVGIRPAEGVEALTRILAHAAPPQIAISTVPIAAAGWQVHGEPAALTPLSSAAVPSGARYSRQDIGTTFAAPISEVEQAIAAVWQQVLGIERVGREDNFFDLGGHSLLLVQAHAALVERLGRSLPVTDLFQFPTIQSLAEHLRGGEPAALRVASGPPPRTAAGEGTAIAIIGMAGRFPGAPDLETFWSNLREGVESIRPVGD